MKKILIIEDDPVAGTVYRRYLEANGYEVDVATDGASGLARLVAHRPDALVLDLMLPQVNGIEVLEAIRAEETYRQLPIVVLTNACFPDFVKRALQSGANEVFDKSKDSPAAILGKVQALVLDAESCLSSAA